jgi:hypothetical protein
VVSRTVYRKIQRTRMISMSHLLRICFIFCFALPALAARTDDFTRYADGTFKYSICVPREWGKSYKDIGYKHILTLARKNGAEITVSATRYDDDEKMKWADWKRWYIRGIGHNLMNIAETKEFAAGNDTLVRILVFDYTARGRRLVQRTMIARHGGSLLVVECRAPVGVFGRCTGLFNTVMSSVDFTGKLSGENMDFLKEGDGGSVKRLEQKKSEKDTGREKSSKKKETETVEPDKKKEEKKEIEQKKEKKIDSGEEDEEEGEETDQGTEREMDSGTKKVIQEQLKKIEELENKGIIEKIDDEKQEK